MNASDSSDSVFRGAGFAASFRLLCLQYVLLVFYEAHKRQKAGLKNPAYFIF